MNCREQQLETIGLGHQGIHALQCAYRQIQVLRHHDNRDAWFDFLDLSRYNSAVQKTQLVIEHNRVYWM